jgi:hypothetical protein
MITDIEFTENIHSNLSIFEIDIDNVIIDLYSQRDELLSILHTTVDTLFLDLQPFLKKNISNIYYGIQNEVSNFLISKRLDSNFKFSIKTWIDSNLIQSEDKIIDIIKNDLLTIYSQRINNIFFNNNILIDNIELQIYKQIDPTDYDKFVVMPDIIDDFYYTCKNLFINKEDNLFNIINKCLIKNQISIYKNEILPIINQILNNELVVDSLIDNLIEGNRDLSIDQEYVIPNLLIDVRKIIFSSEFESQDIINLIAKYKIKYGSNSNILQYLEISNNLNIFVTNLLNLVDKIRSDIETILINSEIQTVLDISDQIINTIILQYGTKFLSNMDLTINLILKLLEDKKNYKFGNVNSQILKLSKVQITEIITNLFINNSIEYIFKNQNIKDIQKLNNIQFKYQTTEEKNTTQLILLEFLSNIKNRRFNIIKNLNLTTLFNDFKLKLSERYKIILQSQIEKILVVIEDLIISTKYTNTDIDPNIIIKNSRLDPIYIKSLIST